MENFVKCLVFSNEVADINQAYSAIKFMPAFYFRRRKNPKRKFSKSVRVKAFLNRHQIPILLSHPCPLQFPMTWRRNLILCSPPSLEEDLKVYRSSRQNSSNSRFDNCKVTPRHQITYPRNPPLRLCVPLPLLALRRDSLCLLESKCFKIWLY